MWLVQLSASLALASGPHAVGWTDLSFDDPVAGRVETRVFYPAAAAGEATDPDRGSGPWPLATFLHGWLGSAWMYDRICEDLASHGYVVVSLDTETGLVLDMADFADDAVAALHWAEERSADPDDFLEGLVSDADWTALGHSMGGATLGRLVGLEPRIRTAVAFMPYEGYASSYEAVRAWDGALLVLSGTADTTAPPAMQREWMSAADLTARSLLVEVTGMGHQAVTDLSYDEDPMPDDEQFEIVSALATTFVRAEHGGDEGLWADLVATPAPEVQTERWSRSHDPALWASLEAGRVSLGVAGLSPSSGEVFLGTGPDEDGGLADGIAVATLDLPLGLAEATVEVPAELSGELWVAVRTDGDDGEVWTRAVPLADAAVEPPATTGATTSPVATTPENTEQGPGPATASSTAGCSTLPGATVAWPWLVGLLVARRRKG